MPGPAKAASAASRRAADPARSPLGDQAKAVDTRAGGAARPAESPASRVAWLDIARGLGIVLVVTGHALGGLIDSPMGAPLLGFRQAFFAIYTFHMPLFFLLAGLLVEPRLARGRSAFLRALLPTLVWPYVLWSVIQFTAVWAMGSLVNRPAGDWWPTILALPWRPVGQFWFLQALVCFHVVAAAALPRIGREGLVLLGLAARSLAWLVPLDPVVRMILANLLWYALGLWLGLGGLQRLVVDRPAWLRAVGLPGLAASLVALTLHALPSYAPVPAIAAASSPEIAGFAWRLLAMAAAIGGALAVVSLASWRPIAVGGILAALGRWTMPIYLLHVLFVAGTRIALIRLGFADPELLLPILVFVGLAGPVLVRLAAGRLGLVRWLGLG